MKQIKKIGLIVSLLAVSIGGGYYLHHYAVAHQQPIHFRVALEEFKHTNDEKAFELHKEQIKNYYTCGNYDKELEKIVENAKHYFEKIPVHDYSVIIFDIHDTSIYDYQTMDIFKFVWACQWLRDYTAARKAPPIKPVLALYNFLLEKGFKVIFITAREDTRQGETLAAIDHAGYKNFTDFFARPDDPNLQGGPWKLSVRKKLACMYDIIGNIGDRPTDFEGGYNGYAVKLPNYLY